MTAEIIAVCGPPGSGKTTLSLKLAMELNRLTDGKRNTILLSPDPAVPSISLIYPLCSKNELYSLGSAMDRTEVCREDVMRAINPVKSLSNLGMLGFVCGENSSSYPTPTEDKVMELLSACKEIAEYTVVDCCAYDDIISRCAGLNADVRINIINPELKSVAYWVSCEKSRDEREIKILKVMNLLEKSLYCPVSEVLEQQGGADFTIPYTEALRQQLLTGTLTEKLGGDYRKRIRAIAEAVL